MVLACSGKCDSDAQKRNRNRYTGNYTQGKPLSENNRRKYCSKCVRFVYDENTRCYCCGSIFRVRARNNKCRN